MRARFFGSLVLLGGAAVLAAACGGSDGVSGPDAAEQLAVIRLEFDQPTFTETGDVFIDLWASTGPVNAPRFLFYSRPVRAADVDRDFRVDGTSANDFAAVVELLTNGENDSLGLTHRDGPPVGVGGGTSRSEGTALTLPSGSPGPDVSGARISHLIVRVLRLDMESLGPGTGGVGERFQLDAAFEVLVIGTR